MASSFLRWKRVMVFNFEIHFHALWLETHIQASTNGDSSSSIRKSREDGISLLLRVVLFDTFFVTYVIFDVWRLVLY